MTSKPQVTITLGRSGQVVKRKDSSEYVPTSLSGTKRSIRDRLGHNNAAAAAADDDDDNCNQPKSKRQRRGGNKKSSTVDDVDGVRVNRNDLRYKLMGKNKSRKTWRDDEHKQKNIDLREKLSRTNQPPLRTDTRQRMPEPKANDRRQGMSEPKATGLIMQIPPTRSADDLVQMDSMRNSYSNWTLDALRRGSPNRLVGTSKGLSPPRTMGNRRPVRHVSSITDDASRPTPFIGKDIYDASRPSTFMPNISVPLEAAKPAVRLPPPTTPGITQKISYMGEEPVTVSGLLHSLGLGKYSIIFQAEEVDMTALKQMGDHDLKELGIPMGPRKKILLSVAGRSKW